MKIRALRDKFSRPYVTVLFILCFSPALSSIALHNSHAAHRRSVRGPRAHPHSHTQHNTRPLSPSASAQARPWPMGAMGMRRHTPITFTEFAAAPAAGSPPPVSTASQLAASGSAAGGWGLGVSRNEIADRGRWGVARPVRPRSPLPRCTRVANFFRTQVSRSTGGVVSRGPE